MKVLQTSFSLIISVMEFNKYGMYSFILEIFTKKNGNQPLSFCYNVFWVWKVSIILLKFATATSLLNSPEKLNFIIQFQFVFNSISGVTAKWVWNINLSGKSSLGVHWPSLFCHYNTGWWSHLVRSYCPVPCATIDKLTSGV